MLFTASNTFCAAIMLLANQAGEVAVARGVLIIIESSGVMRACARIFLQRLY